MNDKGKLLKNIAFMTISEIASKFVVFLTTAYLARTLNPEGIGDLAFINSFYAFFLIAVTFGFSAIGIREISKDKSKLEAFVNTYASVRAIISIVSFALLIAVTLIMDVSYNLKILCIVQGTALLWNAFLLDWVFQGLERMEITSIRQIITAFATLALSVLLVSSPDDLHYAVIINTALVLVNTIWIFTLHQKENAKFKFLIDRKLLRETMPAVLPLGIVAFAIAIQTGVSNIFLKAFSTAEDIGYFYAAYRFSTLTVVLPVAFQNSFLPSLSRELEIKGRAAVSRSYIKINLLVAFMVVAVIFTFSDWFAVTVFGQGFASIGDLTKFLMFTACFSLFNVIFNNCLLAWGYEKQSMYALIASSIVNIAAQYILTPLYGAMGAAYALFASETLMMFVLTFYYIKLSGFRFYLFSIKYFAYIAISCFAGYWASRALSAPVVGLVVTGLVYAGIIFGLKEISLGELLSYMPKRKHG